jgi:hypothetical protein
MICVTWFHCDEARCYVQATMDKDALTERFWDLIEPRTEGNARGSRIPANAEIASWDPRSTGSSSLFDLREGPGTREEDPVLPLNLPHTV